MTTMAPETELKRGLFEYLHIHTLMCHDCAEQKQKEKKKKKKKVAVVNKTTV